MAADILRSNDLQGLVIRAFPNSGPCSGRGPAARLAAKVRRLTGKPQGSSQGSSQGPAKD